ncbi:MAG TPA: TetR/AcrR family transcriptional regulator [Steroidobacteraceae bacterium]|jgi:AcrR family transcriptional regulator|nr:TetR/AcrR family transcriptional regulator [Steroidobacteraceae bacterium]
MPNLTQSAPGRRTRERILDATLALFNERGEPQVSTSLIATELGISAGNLHYHFRRKDELSAALLDRFVAEFNAVLPPAGWRADHVEDAWLLLHLLLETVWRYRFLFRDLSGVMARDRRAAQRIAGVFSRAVAAARAICLGLAEQGTLTATAAEIDALAENVAVVALYWLSFESARHPRREAPGAGMSRGAYQVLMLVAPFLQVESRVHLERLALEYLARR